MNRYLLSPVQAHTVDKEVPFFQPLPASGRVLTVREQHQRDPKSSTITRGPPPRLRRRRLPPKERNTVAKAPIDGSTPENDFQVDDMNQQPAKSGMGSKAKQATSTADDDQGDDTTTTSGASTHNDKPSTTTTKNPSPNKKANKHHSHAGSKSRPSSSNATVAPTPSGSSGTASHTKGSATTSPSSSSSSPLSPACIGQSDRFSCHVGEALRRHVLSLSMLVLAIVVVCWIRWRYYCRTRRRLDQGEYRMVAAQYMDSAFDDSLSDDGDNDEEYDDEVLDDGSWAKSSKKSIEMNSIDRERNGGLTLEEMNG